MKQKQDILTNEQRERYRRDVDRNWEVGTILEIDGGLADVTFVLDRYCFQVSREFFAANKDHLQDFLDLPVALHGDLFGALYSQPDDYSSYPVDILKKFCQSRNTVVEEIVAAVKGLSKREVIHSFKKAFTVSRVNASLSDVTYDYKLDAIMAYGAFEFISMSENHAVIQKKDMSIGLEWAGDRVQTTVIGEVMTRGRNYRYKLNQSTWDTMTKKLWDIGLSPSTRSINSFLYGAAPKARQQCEDAAYGIRDRYAMIERHIYNQNWIYRAIKKMITQQNIGYLQVEGTGRPFRHWYNRLSNDLPSCAISLDEEQTPPTDQRRRTCYMRCPFQTIFGSKFMAPLLEDIRSNLSYKASYEGCFLKGLFPKAEEYDLQVAHFDDYPVPWKIKKGRPQFTGDEDHSFFGTTFHRCRGLMVTGKVEPQGDVYRVSKKSAGHLKFFGKRILGSYKRNTIIFEKDLNVELITPVVKWSKVRNKDMTDHMEEYGEGLFFPCIDVAVDSTSNGIVMGIGVMMREVANGVMPYKLKYSDFPESIFHLREEIISYGLVLGIVTVLESNRMESVFMVNLPFILKDLGRSTIPTKNTLVECFDANKTFVSKNGGIIGSLDKPVEEVVFFDGSSAFEQGRIDFGLSRMRRPKLSTTLQKGRNKWRVKEQGKLTLEKAYKLMIHLLSTYAKTRTGVAQYMKKHYSISGSIFSAAWKELLKQPNMVGKVGKVYIWET